MELVKYKNKNIEVIDNYLHLQGLGIDNIDDIEGLNKLRTLEGLFIYANQIKEIKGLNSLKNLKVLLLHYNQITEIKGLENLKNLEVLNLLGNEIVHIRGLENLTNLKILTLSENLITEIQGLSNLSSLEQLYLNNNRITHIHGLENLHKLRLFFIKDNPIAKDLLHSLGGLTPEGKANNPRKFVEYCNKSYDDIKVELILDPIPMNSIEDEVQIAQTEPNQNSIHNKITIKTNLEKIPHLAREHKYLEAMELLEKSKELAIQYEFYELADDIYVKLQDIKFQRTNYHIDNALKAFKNTTMCSIHDISEYITLHLPDFNMNERKLKLKVLSRINSLNIRANIHNDYVIFKEFELNQQMLEDVSERSYTYTKKECKYCGENIDEEAIICPLCGIDQEEI